MVKRTPPCLGALAVVAALACAAPAQGDAPQVDPDSPAGTEYQLPLDRAREEAGAGAGADRSAKAPGGAAPLFGKGVERSESPPSMKPPADSSSDSDPAKTPRTERDTRRSPTDRVRAQARSPETTGGALLTVGAGAGGVVLLGGMAGLMWRRRSR